MQRQRRIKMVRRERSLSRETLQVDSVGTMGYRLHAMAVLVGMSSVPYNKMAQLMRPLCVALWDDRPHACTEVQNVQWASQMSATVDCRQSTLTLVM